MKNKGFLSFLRGLGRAALCLIVGLALGALAMTAVAWLNHPEADIVQAAETAKKSAPEAEKRQLGK